VHWRLSLVPARTIGLYDRAVPQPGMAADVLVYDFENLRTNPEEHEVVATLCKKTLMW
jgi:N-acyl-D-aspartate/D-glutamate deacylase